MEENLGKGQGINIQSYILEDNKKHNEHNDSDHSNHHHSHKKHGKFYIGNWFKHKKPDESDRPKSPEELYDLKDLPIVNDHHAKRILHEIKHLRRITDERHKLERNKPRMVDITIF
ncbi:DgyrCDS10079 [Dimorphilus gyrociliatus]|uniref:DgyrCDS10079 n=1 Tax=Dimorphilus gyrociliatus TaxID=2664684 RepID=A0A7I8W482_9ANNE|nr:DgyrCDS10079 [Dimorphilus gyrociliatus]